MALSTDNSTSQSCTSWTGVFENVLSYTNYYIEFKNSVNFTLTIYQIQMKILLL